MAELNPDTRVAVCCYAGDAHQVTEMLDLYTHHECPVTILSPAEYSTVPLDALFDPYVAIGPRPTPLGSPRVDIPGLDCRSAGKAAIVGQDSLDRQAEHLKILLTYPEKFFFVNDSDSFCLSPELPKYLYETDVLWSSMIADNMAFRAGLCEGPSGEPRKKYYPDGFPKLAFQPPYFFSRATLEKLVAASAVVKINPHLPFIDHYMVQLAVQAGVSWAGFIAGFSAPISSHPDMPAAARDKVRDGTVILHGAKGKRWSDPLVQAYRERHP